MAVAFLELLIGEKDSLSWISELTPVRISFRINLFTPDHRRELGVWM